MTSIHILVGAGLIGVGLLLIVLGIRKNKQCSGSKTIGIITGVHEDVTTDNEGFHSYSYSPEYQYEVNGQVYHGSGGIAYAKRKKVPIGGSIVIYYNPDNPQAHQIKGSGKTLPILGIAVMFLGAIYLAGAFYQM